MITSILIANRGEIACRIIRTCRSLGIRAIAVYSDADEQARHVKLADEAVHIGSSPASDSYLVSEKIIAAALQVEADAIHPGFGFLAENADFAQACADAGIIFIGPAPEVMAAMGNKRAAKALVEAVGVPTIPGYGGEDQTDERLRQEAERVGYPLMVKAAAGGGGKGMRLVTEAAQLAEALVSARREAKQAFGSGELILEWAIMEPRHVEFQVFGDTQGNIIHLGERECSIQRRHQKVIEETPSPALTPELRQRMGETAVRRLLRALQTTTLLGLTTNISFLQDILRQPAFQSGNLSTHFIDQHLPYWQPPTGDLEAALIAASLAQFQQHPQIDANSGYWRNNPNGPLGYRYVLNQEQIDIHLMPSRHQPHTFSATIQNRTLFTIHNSQFTISLSRSPSTTTVKPSPSSLPKPMPGYKLARALSCWKSCRCCLNRSVRQQREALCVRRCPALCWLYWLR